MANLNIALSSRAGGVIVLPITADAIDNQVVDITVTSTPTSPALLATASSQIWEIVPDVDVRVLFSVGGATAVAANTGRKLKAGIPYTFGATKGFGPSFMLG